VPEVWDILEEVIREHPVMLNRAPTLHRLGIQAFEPVLIEGKAIQLHPLVCAAFNADFDGDQMAVHVPLSLEAQMEARTLMLASNNVLSPANGEPIIVPSQDIVLGLYYATRERINAKGEGMSFSDLAEVHRAYDSRQVEINARVWVRIKEKELAEDGEIKEKITRYETTVGRALLSEILPVGLSFELLNKPLKKKEISRLINIGLPPLRAARDGDLRRQAHAGGLQHRHARGHQLRRERHADPDAEAAAHQRRETEVKEIENQYTSGLVTAGERYNKVVDIWSRCGEQVGKVMMEQLGQERRSRTATARR
jgi:DNA-directed RNA polymerase subunit beta'